MIANIIGFRIFIGLHKRKGRLLEKEIENV